MIQIREKDTEVLIGEISADQLQFLIDQLEEEDTADRDYAITPMLLQAFKLEGADEELVSMLREAMGGRETMEIIWSRAV
jgi:processive 1,2-diacylglycerol beta-glucosyltransferase